LASPTEYSDGQATPGEKVKKFVNMLKMAISELQAPVSLKSDCMAQDHSLNDHMVANGRTAQTAPNH